MKRWIQIVIGLLLVVLALVAWVGWAGPSSREPVYQGKLLSEWLRYADEPPSVSPAAKQAVQAIGRKAIPTLLRWLRAKDSFWAPTWNDPPWKQKLIAWGQKHKFLALNPVPARLRQRQGELGFICLGIEAKEALPDIIDVYQRATAVSSQWAAASVIGSLGPAAREAIPALIRGVGHTNLDMRAKALETLGQIQSEPRLVLPVLVSSLSDPNPNVRFSAVRAIADFGDQAKPIVPALVRSLEDPDLNTRVITISTLANLQTDPDSVVPALTRTLNEDPDKFVRTDAAMAIGDFGEQAKSAIPALVNARKSQAADGQAITRALRKIDPQSMVETGDH